MVKEERTTRVIDLAMYGEAAMALISVISRALKKPSLYYLSTGAVPNLHGHKIASPLNSYETPVAESSHYTRTFPART
jgi:hypothetical protein